MPQTGQRIAIDITHHDGQAYLSVNDCGPARFAVWRPLRRQDRACVVQRLEEIFYERGPQRRCCVTMIRCSVAALLPSLPLAGGNCEVSGSARAEW